MIPSHHELLPMQRAHACLGGGDSAAMGQPRRSKPAHTSGTMTRAATTRRSAAATVGTVWPSGSPPVRKAWGAPPAAPHGTLDTQERAHAITLSSL